MPSYTVTGPSGKSYTIDGPEGATADQLGQVILANSHEERAAAELASEKAQYNPTNDMGTGERLLAGIGRGMASVGRGLMGAVGQQSAQDTADAKQVDAPLLGTTSGKIGNAVGTAAALSPVILAPGGGTYAGAAAYGGITGALTTEGDLKDRAKGAVGGAAGGAAGIGIGKAVSAGGALIKNALTKAAANDAGRTAAVQAAQDAGYVLPPMQIEPTFPNALAQAWSGPIKTTQAAAAANQLTTNKLARAAVGLGEDAPITKDALAEIRAEAGNVYSEVRGIGQVAGDQTYMDTLNGLKSKYVSAASDFPGLIDSKVTDALDAIAKPSFKASSAVDAIRILRDRAQTAFAQGEKSVGNDLKGGADALEGAIERTLQKQATPVYAPREGPMAGNAGPALTNGAPGNALTTELAGQNPQMLEQVGSGVPSDLLSRFRDARATIAKTYDIEKALKGENVDAATLARLQNKRGGLTGELATIAQTASNFKKATNMPTEAYSPYSAVDAGISMNSLAGAMAMHNPMLAIPALGSALRPAVRGAILSAPGQAAAHFQPGPTTANALALALQNPATRAALMVGGVSRGSNLLASYGQQ